MRRAIALYVAANGKIGLRTATPGLDIHAVTGNTPAIRLEQTNAGGYVPQTWDIGGNEANFTTIAKAAGDVPVMLYNVPPRVVTILEPELIADLAKVPNIVALKQAHGDLDQLRDVHVYAGTREIMYPDAARLVEKIKESRIPVDFTVGRGMFHIYPLYPVPEADAVMKQVVKIVNG